MAEWPMLVDSLRQRNQRFAASRRRWVGAGRAGAVSGAARPRPSHSPTSPVMAEWPMLVDSRLGPPAARCAGRGN